jgi:tetratricopeptide (TPR) repeat protein
MNLDKLKETARRYELREEWRKAIETYIRAAEELADAGEPVDPSLFNRVGDLELKAGAQGAALKAYERAADYYADQGFFNNAIALCGKMLRVDARRTQVYLRLAELHARKNVVAEARRNATEYFERMQGAGQLAEAAKALRGFALRFSASQELTTAINELLKDVEEPTAETSDGLADEAPVATGPRPSPQQPATGSGGPWRGAGGLVFLDTGFEPPPFARNHSLEAESIPGLVGSGIGEDLVGGEPDSGANDLLDMVEPTSVGDVFAPGITTPIGGFEPTRFDDPGSDLPEVEMLIEYPDADLLEVPGLEPTHHFVDLDESPLGHTAGSSPHGDALFEGLEVESDAPHRPRPSRHEAGAGSRETALELQLAGCEREGRWTDALEIVVELARHEPRKVAWLQKRVELAYRTGEKDILVSAYLALGDALVQIGATTNASMVYERVLDHEPANAIAVAAIAALNPAIEATPAAGEKIPEGGFIDLGALILDPEPDRDTRMRVEQGEPVGDEDQDFLETLAQFKEGLAANVDANDFQTHYDLGIAFKEMGLLDEAIAQFQKALHAPGGMLKSAEALGMAFYEKGRFGIAEAVMSRAVDALPDVGGEKIGLLYWMGRAVEEQGRQQEAMRWYERAMAMDITFLDVSDRLHRLAPGDAR